MVQEASSVPFFLGGGGLGRAGTWRGTVAGLGSSQQPHLATSSPSTHFPALASKGHQLNTIANV